MTNLHFHQNQIVQDRFGLKVAARLSDAVDSLPYDIAERLRAARVQALGKRKVVSRTVAAVNQSGGGATLSFGSDHLSWWDRVAATLPLLILILGLIAINVVQNDRRANELAEIDAALLTDDLPPTAYADPGFTQFLKNRSGQD